MQNINNIIKKSFSVKSWRNVSQFCNGKRHPEFIYYRRYRRGRYRCKECGSKIGKIKCVYKSNMEILYNNISNASPMLKILREKGAIVK